jgi:hypothetical protein
MWISKRKGRREKRNEIDTLCTNIKHCIVSQHIRVPLLATLITFDTEDI